ncbi:hypothetical protein SPRG_00799 [Saprolegnia parasitica CBS 223.65]|uniref:AMP-dependent synthetase/ligase domain-containing protein n=1 Tax=Saprolegnia parasitica (strain CBS 223.65) TaxID=695850 RepID=A0A067D6W6_SAPPC|nr:hypothetical protein SPRG_00799 [Saprolegnia parasitica CBS 223.65]KDO34737.1 hypothetical protein SPRG_00799 [Saprolegnia parasitica CBS 223.65]|eukprot:XP_012194406.1 hypothetical protein SPRG_00799 [Saprolegnia parasitica CBS 223.65]
MVNASTSVSSLLPLSLAVPSAIAVGVGSYLLYTQHSAAPLRAPTTYATPDASTATAEDGPIYRCKDTFPTLESATQIEMLQKAVSRHPNRDFLGHRPIDAASGEAGPFVWQTYAECYARIQHIASGLLHDNMVDPTTDGHKLVSIYMKNRPEWSLGQYAAFYAGAAIVPLYDTLGATSTAFILNQTEAPTVLLTTSEWPSLVSKAGDTTHLRHIVLCDVPVVPLAIAAECERHGWRATTLLEVEANGRNHGVSAPHPLTASDLCIIMYTSGTTGDPKGAMMTHGNLLSLTFGLDERINHGAVDTMLQGHPTLLSYLPLAHVAEQQLHIFLLRYAGSIGFYQGSAASILDDLRTLRPTLFLSVPRLLNRIYDSVMAAGNSAGGLKTTLFQTALASKRANLRRGYSTHLVYDKLVFNKIKATLGLDRCELMLTGAAPISAHVLTFFRVLLGVTCHEIYGQTEVSGASNITDHRELDAGFVGPPLHSCNVKLVSVPDMGYLVTDTVHGSLAVAGRGEICMRGPSVFQGYFKNPALTKEAIDADGWLHSGDIGVWTLDGRLKILSQGEYVAPEKVENVLKNCAFVNQSFVYGDSLHAVLVAIVVIDEPQVAALASTLGLESAVACTHPSIVEHVTADIARVSKEHGLLGFETVRAVHLTTDVFTVENKLLTPTFKVRRNDVKLAYKATIEALYAATDAVAGENIQLA